MMFYEKLAEARRRGSRDTVVVHKDNYRGPMVGGMPRSAFVSALSSQIKDQFDANELAQRLEDEKKPPSTMAGNLIGLGIGGAGVVGASRYMSQPQRDFEKNLKHLAGQTERTQSALFDAFRKKYPQSYPSSAQDKLFADLDKARELFDEGTEELRDVLKSRLRHRVGKALAIGGLGIAGGIGAKKLYDRFNQHKQQRD